MRCGSLFLILPLIVMIIIFPGCGSDEDKGLIYELGGKWEVMDITYARPGVHEDDGMEIHEISLPADFNRFLQKDEDYKSILRLRKVFIPDRDIDEPLMVLSLNNIGVADEAYINGVCIGATGSFPDINAPLSYNFAWHEERHYRFPAGILKPGEKNVIDIIVYYHMINGLRTIPVLYSLEGWQSSQRLPDYLPSMRNLNPLLLSFFLLLLLALTMKGTANRKISLYLILFIISVFGVTLLMMGVPRMENNLARFKLFLVLYVFADYLLVLFMQEFFRIRSRVLSIAATAVLLIFIIFTIWAPNGLILVTYGSPLTACIITAYIAAALIIFLKALYRDPRRYWYLTIIGAFVLFSVSDTLYSLFTGRLYLISHTFVLRLPVLIFGVLLVYLLDLKNVKKERDSLTGALLKKERELRRILKEMPKKEYKPEPRDNIHKLIDYLDNNYNESYDRKKLAELFNMNEDYMGHLFKKITKTNIANYINTRRIEAAKQLLTESESKVIDIAFHVGFDNLTYFYRYFKKHTGYSPVEYRKIRQMVPAIEVDDE